MDAQEVQQPNARSFVKRPLLGTNAFWIAIPSVVMWFVSMTYWPWRGFGLVVVPLLLAAPTTLLALLVDRLAKVRAYVPHRAASIFGNLLSPAVLWWFESATETGGPLDFILYSSPGIMLLGIPMTLTLGSVGFLLPGLMLGAAHSIRERCDRFRKA